MNNPFSTTIQTVYAGIPFDIQIEGMALSSDKVRILAHAMTGSQKVDLSKEDLEKIHALILRLLNAAENL